MLGHIVEAGGAAGENEQRAALVLGEFAHGGVLPGRNPRRLGKGESPVANRLAQGEGDSRRGVGDILAEHEHAIGPLDFADRGIVESRILRERDHLRQAGVFGVGAAGVEVFPAHELAQGEIGLDPGPGRADGDRAAAIGRDFPQPVLRGIGFERIALPVQRCFQPPRVVHIASAEAAPVADEVAIEFAVVAVDDAAQFAVALAGCDVAANAAAGADRGRGLQIPLAGVVFAEDLVGENPGGANLDEIAAELAFEHALAVAAEIGVVVRRLGGEIGPAGVLAIEAHAAVAGDAAVHLVIDEGAEILVAVGDFLLVVAAVIVARHQRHVLEVAFAALLADRAVVGVADHQAFDDSGAESLGLGVFDGDSRPGLRRGHAGHGEQAGLVFFAAVLLHRALAAGAHRTHARMPAEIRQVEALGQALLQQVVAGIDLVGHAIDQDFNFRLVGHGWSALNSGMGSVVR